MAELCLCGCGKPTKMGQNEKQNKYVHGHNRPWLGRKRGPLPKSVREKMSKAHLGKKYNMTEAGREVCRKNIRKAHTPEVVAKMKKTLTGRKLTREHVRNSMRRRTPSSLEEKMEGIINELNLPYKFTGNGAVMVDNLNPDFVHSGGKKIAIEVYARIYKQIDGRSIKKWKKSRRLRFGEYGWKMFFFDETQVKNSHVKQVLGGSTN